MCSQPHKKHNEDMQLRSKMYMLVHVGTLMEQAGICGRSSATYVPVDTCTFPGVCTLLAVTRYLI